MPEFEMKLVLLYTIKPVCVWQTANFFKPQCTGFFVSAFCPCDTWRECVDYDLARLRLDPQDAMHHEWWRLQVRLKVWPMLAWITDYLVMMMMMMMMMMTLWSLAVLLKVFTWNFIPGALCKYQLHASSLYSRRLMRGRVPVHCKQKNLDTDDDDDDDTQVSWKRWEIWCRAQWKTYRKATMGYQLTASDLILGQKSR